MTNILIHINGNSFLFNEVHSDIKKLLEKYYTDGYVVTNILPLNDDNNGIILIFDNK